MTTRTKLFRGSFVMLVSAILFADLIGCEVAAVLDAKSEVANILSSRDILFEVEYANYAWGPQLNGYYVDGEGAVWRYDHSHARWSTERSDAFTHEELMEKFSHGRERIDSVSADTLSEMASLIASAAEGSLTDPVGRCYDFGTISFRAFEFDAGDSLYRPVLLFQAGDVARKNTSSDAERITDWLMHLGGKSTLDSCLP